MVYDGIFCGCMVKQPCRTTYFDETPYVKVPAFWGTLVNASQLQHGLASVSEKELTKDTSF